MAYTRITSIEQLMELANTETGVECFIHLNNGLRSSKRIWYDDKQEVFCVYNEIDDTEDDNLSIIELSKNTNIVEAINKNAFYQY